MTLPDSRAFLVRLSDRMDPAAGVPIGVIEHVESGLRARFSSIEGLEGIEGLEEIRDFIALVLAQEAALEVEAPDEPLARSFPCSRINHSTRYEVTERRVKNDSSER